MPTAAQRQRAAAAAMAAVAAAAGAPLHPKHGQGLQGQKAQQQHSQQKQQQQSQKPPMGSSKTPSDDAAFSDEDSDEIDTAAAFEMDSQELWTQNYCATCDCLIEPGQGVGVKRKEEVSSPTASLSRSTAAGLKSKAGTIKGRHPSSEGQAGGTMKRTHSAGKLHAVGGAGVLGPHKRTGSAGGRLNALSDLRPTTKLNGESNRPKGATTAETGPGKKSPALSRRNSAVSDKSGANSASSSGPSSPASPNTSLPRSKKGGLIASTLRKDDEIVEDVKAKSTPALYCTERCRSIDEQRSSGLGELVYYLQQPASPPSTWNSGSSSTNNAGMGYGTWSGSSVNTGTPESECTCPECMERTSAGGTMPSGASDTTESSVSYQYGQARVKQRSQSGRIVTPQNLLPPGNHGMDYFGQAGAGGKRRSASKPLQRHTTELLPDVVSQVGTEGSALSSANTVHEWPEPASTSSRPSRAARRNTSEEALTTATTGTVTPAAQRSSPQCSDSPSMWSNGYNGSVGKAMGVSQASTSSPLRLLRRGDLHAQPSVDISADYARSPQANPSSLLSRSLASEHTERAASSSLTLATGSGQSQLGSSQLSSSLFDRRQNSRLTDSMDLPRLAGLRVTDNPAPMNPAPSSSSATFALDSLKDAQTRANREGAAPLQHADGQQSSGSSNSTGVGASWLRSSLSSAWNSLRGLPMTSSGPLEDDRGAKQQSNQSIDLVRGNSTDSNPLWRLSSALSAQNGGTCSREEEKDDPTPTQSQIARPRIRRGDVPAFASEIGRGEIPGERGEEAPGSGYLSHSLASAHGSFDERRRLKRAEKERMQRHQRSKDVTVLPPLLGVHRTSSSVNVNRPIRPTPAHSSTASSSGLVTLQGQGNRGRAGSNGPSVHSGSFGSLAAPSSNAVMRPNTPGMRNSASANLSAGELASSPSGRISGVGSLGTSPRRAGLGWGAMTSIASPDASQTSFGSHRPPSHASLRPGHPSHHHHHHQQQHHRPAPQHSSRHHHHRSSGGSSSSNLVPLGHVGLLGAHPHGHGPVFGRHATTPVRSNTPRVPEDGGEMSGAALKGEEDGSGSETLPNRRSFIAPPSRPHSVTVARGHPESLSPATARRNSSQHRPHEAHHRNTSSDDVRAPKMYPVLDLPNRQPTHDRYDSGWNLDERGLSDLLRNPSTTRETLPEHERQTNPNDAPRPHRKRLFYFDTS